MELKVNIENIKLKVDTYDEDTHHMLVSLECSVDGKQYNTGTHNFNISNHDGETLDDFLKSIASYGVNYIIEQIRRERISSNETLKQELKEVQGREISYDINQLSVNFFEKEDNSDVVDNLEIVL